MICHSIYTCKNDNWVTDHVVLYLEVYGKINPVLNAIVVMSNKNDYFKYFSMHIGNTDKYSD